MYFNPHPIVNIYTGKIDSVSQLIPFNDRVFACFIPKKIEDILVMKNVSSSLEIHLHQPLFNHLQSNHNHIYTEYQLISKRSVNSLFTDLMQRTIQLLGSIGHTFTSYLQKIAKSMHFDSISRTMQFYSHYFSLVVPIAQSSISAKHAQFTNFMEKEDSSTLNDTSIPTMASINSTLVIPFVSDGRVQMMHDVVLPHLSKFDLSQMVSKYANISHNITQGRMPSSIPSLTHPMSFLQSIKNQGQTIFKSVVANTNAVIPEYLGDMYFIMSKSITDLPLISQFMSTHFPNVKINILSLFSLLTSTEATYTFIYHRNKEPFTNEDIECIRAIKDGSSLMKEWIGNKECGDVTALKEYEVHARLDWFPRIYSAILQQINFMINKKFGGLIYAAIYTLASFIIALCVVPMPYIKGNETKAMAMQNIAPLPFMGWYLWAYSCVLHLARTPLTLIDPTRTGLLQKWFQLKALTVGIPSAYINLKMMHLLERHLDLKDPIHKRHFELNVFGWASDSISMIVPYFKGLDAFDVTTLSMVIGYTARINWMMAKGIPGVIPYYESIFSKQPGRPKEIRISMENRGARVESVSQFWKENDPVDSKK